jgi:PAS domain S-box-containing protein
MKTYQEELQALHHRRVYYILLAGGILMMVFSLLDMIIAPELFREFLLCRTVVLLIGVVLLIFNYYDQGKKYPLATGFVGYLCVGFVFLAMIYRMGGVVSPYYVGLILTMTIYAALAPLTPGQTLNSGFTLVCFYGIILLFDKSVSSKILSLESFASLFFLVSFVLIITIQSWADTKARKNEFRLRHQEDQAAEQLSKQADMLEVEVEKRSIEQAESEERYRLLFSQIADDVILITPKGEILQSNHNFDKHYADDSSAVGKSLFGIIVERQREDIRALFQKMIATGTPVTDLPLFLMKEDSTITEAEMNGNVLLHNEEMLGILLVIRDISTRKEMELRLIRSLEVRKKTETAAILALAKLSEFRDVRAGNHLERIREYCKILAVELSQYGELQAVMSPTYIEDIYHASILHDIGKVAIPDEFMTRTTPLMEHEKDILRRHTIIGGDVIREMEEESKGSGFLDMAKYIAYFHHERWDGRGYPYGLMKREIPLAARIMSLADTYEELSASTPDNPGKLSPEQIRDYIVRNSGLQFDPMVVEAFLVCQDDFNAIRLKYSEQEGE